LHGGTEILNHYSPCLSATLRASVLSLNYYGIIAEAGPLEI
jgi:hypothetical protein